MASSLIRNPWFLAAVLVYFGFIAMLIYGVVLCEVPSSQDYVCPGSACSENDEYGQYSWGPCGSGYSGSSDSTCALYCGDNSGVVCALRDYYCFSGAYKSNYYCARATYQCTDPTALALIIIGSVMVGLMTVFAILLYMMYDDFRICPSSAPANELPQPHQRSQFSNDSNQEAILNDIPMLFNPSSASENELRRPHQKSKQFPADSNREAIMNEIPMLFNPSASNLNE